MNWFPEVDPSYETELWTASGADLLTGRADGPPGRSPGAPASVVQAALATVARHHPHAHLPEVDLLSDRARSAGFTRNAPWSCGGSFRILATGDGWLGLSLSRPSDIALIPALVSSDAHIHDPWDVVSRWLAVTPTQAAAARLTLLGLAGGAVTATVPDPRREPVVAALGGLRHNHAPPLVVDLTSLWAGPLCGALLAATGADVVKVESRTRPDGCRQGSPEFFDRMNGAKRSLVLDFQDRHELERLHRLVSQADVVLEASRPRALRDLGIRAEDHVARGAVWVSLTAYGRLGADALRVGFGDDVAAAAGLVAWTDEGPIPVGDALADPLTGAVAAAAATTALLQERGVLLDVSMYDTAVRARRIVP